MGMTDTRDPILVDAAIESAVARIDAELPSLFKRDLVSADEMANLLLDVRTLLAPVRVPEEDLLTN